MSDWTAEGHILMTHEVGLHARPSVSLTKLAKGYASAIELGLGEDGPWVDAKSVVKVMGAKAPKGTVIYFRARGDDAEDAVAALTSLVARNFDEGRRDVPG